MASFDPEELRDEATRSSGLVKYPMNRLELSVRKFIKVLDIDLDRLHKHTENIKKLTNAEDWVGLHKEQVNASRTVQQINANIREIERARTQVVDKDLSLFDSKVQDVKSKAVSAMEVFMILIGPGTAAAPKHISSKDRPTVETGHGSCDIQAASSHSTRPNPQEAETMLRDENEKRPGDLHTPSRSAFYEEDSIDSALQDNPPSLYGTTSMSMTTYAPAPVTTSLHVAPQHTDASVSWEQLQESIVELNELVHHFADNVQQQGEVLNSIEANIDSAHTDIQEGTVSLVQASKYKSAMLPVVGAVVGGLVGGPIGFVAGMKLGGLAGVIGGAAGFAGGRMLKKRQAAIAQVEMENLSDKRSVSLSETDNPLDNKPSGQTAQPSMVSGADRKLLLEEEEITQESNSGHSSRNFQGLTEMYSGMTSSFKNLFSASQTPAGKSS